MIKKLLFIFPILLSILCIAFISPDTVVQYFGENNTYIAMFFLAFIGGVSVFSTIPYPIFLVSFALGGLDPTRLSLLCVIGVMGGDSISYFIGKKGKKMIDGKFKKYFEKILILYDTKKNYLPFFFFLYGALSPLPNDLITFSSGFKNYSFIKMILPLSLGNFIFCMVISHFCDYFAQFV